MKPRPLALLLLSHGGLILLGGWLADRTREKTPAPVAALPAAVAPKAPSPRPVEETTTNPIFRATGADFRAAWDEMLAGPRGSNGEPHGNSLNFFVDWCAVDPDGAIQGLGRLHAPRFAHNYLGNAINYHGAKLAPAFVKHWRKLDRLQDYKVQHAVARSLNALAKENPEAAAALTSELPLGMRKEAYGALFDQQDTAAIGRLLKGLPSLAPDATEEKTTLWKEVAEAVDAADSQRGLWDWMARADDAVARRELAIEGMHKAYKAEDWSGFFDAVERMDPSARTEVRELMRQVTRSASYRPEALAAITAECRRHGLDDWLQGPVAE